MSWFAAVPAILVGVLLVLTPGIPVALALGARGITFLAVSIGASVSAIALSSIVASLLGLGWQPLVPFLVSLPIAVLGWVLRRLWRRRWPLPAEHRAWGWPFAVALAAIGIAAVLIALPLKAGIGMPDWPSQTYDASFHLNAVQQVLQTADASPFRMTVSTPDRSSGFYPTAWHALAALVVQVSHVSIPVAANALSFVISCLVWPVACVFLARQVFGQRPLALALAGILSAGFASFPLLLVEFGVLYPNLLAVALLPIALGLLAAAVGQARGAGLQPGGRWLIVLWVVVGMGLAHPSAVFAIMLLGLPLAAQGVIGYLRRSRAHTRDRVAGLWGAAALLAATVLGTVLWLSNGTGDNAWQPYQTGAQAVGEALLNAPLLTSSALVVSALGLVGIVASLRQPRFLWLTVSYALSILLFVVASSWPDGVLRTSITGLWYNDWARLAAMLPLLAIPLATLGALVLVRALHRVAAALQRGSLTPTARTRPVRRRIRGAVSVLALVALIPLTQDVSISDAEQRMSGKYELSGASALLSPDEIAIFDVVRTEVPADAVLGGNPWNGSALVYAYTGRKALFPHVGGAYDAERMSIGAGFSQSAATLCDAIRDKNMTHVLDFGPTYIFGDDPRSRAYPGFDNLEQSSAVALVAERGTARLYEVTVCATP